MTAATRWLEKDLKGRTIVAVTDLDEKELGWFEPAIALVLDDGTIVVPMRDPEGNGPGGLMVLPEETA